MDSKDHRFGGEEKSMVSKVARPELIKRRKIIPDSDVQGYDRSKEEYFLTVYIGSTGLSYLSIPVSDLFRGDHLDLALNHLDVDEAPFGSMNRRCFCVKGSLYLIGGNDSDNVDHDSDNMDHDSDLMDPDWYVSTDVMRFDICSSRLKGGCKRSPMLSKKMVPVILEHQNIIYILSGSMEGVGSSRGCFFESYNTDTDKWDFLAIPPYFDEKSPYYHPIIMDFSYFVIDNKICVSQIDYLAFVYDIKENEWEPCHLFGHYEGYDFGVFERPGHLLSDFDWSHDDSIPGQPFPFLRGGIVVDNKYLIATEIFAGLAIVYAIFDGKVEKKQILLDFSLTFGMNDTFESLFALRDDIYCLSFCRQEYDDFMFLTLLIFRASPKEDYEGCGSDEFFTYQFLKRCSIRTKGDSFPLLSFVT